MRSKAALLKHEEIYQQNRAKTKSHNLHPIKREHLLRFERDWIDFYGPRSFHQAQQPILMKNKCSVASRGLQVLAGERAVGHSQKSANHSRWILKLGQERPHCLAKKAAETVLETFVCSSPAYDFAFPRATCESIDCEAQASSLESSPQTHDHHRRTNDTEQTNDDHSEKKKRQAKKERKTFTTGFGPFLKNVPPMR
jgi:hypothetical protein